MKIFTAQICAELLLQDKLTTFIRQAMAEQWGLQWFLFDITIPTGISGSDFPVSLRCADPNYKADSHIKMSDLPTNMRSIVMAVRH
ncbi:hypothetical protein EOE67_18770 [Rheinheimera riviphila]|uniref:Uncharacterized protein n=1 Tax=Rheinheimera riviphila TaxID=1834037 RepID=A0A437QEZ7_9GAMM|nr:hypothetical protein [Rheinheimera riviphila]RVU33025.1 hypothetical protein EOE67_18770 [Rheinheimera riviphila]